MATMTNKVQPTRASKFLQWINYRVRVTIHDPTNCRQLVGTLIAFDKHMNLVLTDTEEFRKIKGKKVKIPQVQGEENKKQEPNQPPPDRTVKRPLGLVLLRGESIVTMSAEAPPNQAPRKLGEGIQGGPGGPPVGMSAPINRNVQAPPTMPPPHMMGAPPGLAGPGRGVGMGVQPPMGPPPGMSRGPPGGMPPPPGMQPPPPGMRPPPPMQAPPQGPPPGLKPPPPMSQPPRKD